MGCVRRSRLEKNRDRASARVDAIRQRLHERIAVCLKEEFLMLSDDLDRASEELDEARAALDEHVRRHCCMTQQSAGANTEGT